MNLKLAELIELATIPLPFLQCSDLYSVPTRFYESVMHPKLILMKNLIKL